MKVYPISLLDVMQNFVGYNLTISGWGKVNYEGFSTATDRGIDGLQEADVPIINPNACADDKVSSVQILGN